MDDFNPHMTRIGNGLFMTPSDAAMTREHMEAWFRARGVRDTEYLDELLAENAGRTEREMDEEYDRMHPQPVY